MLGIFSGAGFILLDAFLYGSLPIFFVYLAIAIFFSGLWQMVQYFRMPEKDYVRLEKDHITLDKGALLPRKTVHFDRVERLAEINDVMLLKMENGQEQEIYTEWLAHEDTKELRISLKERINT
ncbi:hypothetical protein GCM10010954_37200 [Halobacillus andaensis]|uniref:Uncharacterized protein n=1 Tax=Halobacillus andaensis TaxID=1176239 RepID=A0A917BBS6_HALAA|nr:hypothetical protein [Halobacillus andaensis]MBP2006375.1 hypothetical protein [Halobacillus andaensis]GGF34674.1 hypothetical protein GCM10010954_37200 [Halobacillus andaensis]